MKKRLGSLLLAAILIISILPAFPAFASTAWNGSTKTQPAQTNGIYQIGNGDELAWFAEQTKTDGTINAVLTDDIDLGSKEWTPIGMPASGYVTEAYAGTFDGQGHTISGLYISTSSAFYGLFYCVYGGTVKNVNVIGNVTTTGNTAGGIVGKLQGGTIENCSFDGSVTAKGNYAGGIVANIVTNSKTASTITGCCNKGEINGKYAGGILGYTTAKASISHCYNTGIINGITRSAGISGQQTTGTISYCYNIGSSTSGIYGFSNAAITNCYYLNDETATPGGTASGYEKIIDAALLLENLNADDDKHFCKDTKNKNNGYPVLNWQNKLTPEEEAAEQKKKEDTEKVKKAIEELSIDTSTIKDNCILNLPYKIGDCSIEWTSSNTDIINNKGAVTLPDKNIVNVTLTAKITCGEISESKDFTISVWSENIDADVYLQTVLDAMKWNFKELQPVYGQDSNIIIKFQNLLKSKGYDGITITINSTSDESLISKTGKIFYPEIDKNSFADGSQVKVFFNLSLNGTSVTYPETDIYSLLIPWDTSSLKEELEKSTDNALADSIIADKNASLDAVSSDLNLPSNIARSEGKYSFAWVTWESSDTSHLSISEENRNGSADALYNPYIGKIHQDNQEHTVTLTATIKNPSTDVTIKKIFTVTVAPLPDEELHHTLDKMNAILSCYTADKLTDSATKEQLNVNAVDNDIQLVIPRNVVTADELTKLDYGKYWDYWNYKFTVTSSDTDVIEINSFRAFVYRPLGEDASADKKITMTVKMESKANPNLFVTKDIDVTVKHLSRTEINSALELMDQAKVNYANGLLGNNTDIYSIIDNLTPYKEIVWNYNKSGVDFVYRNDDIHGNGIIVDELPNWEQQEDWRLFRTSNRDLLANETLILNETPSEDTFVKINSVLTDESLGKYYIKFQNNKNYDIEAIAKFKQLYKQPVSAYVMAVGSGNYTDTFVNMPTSNKASSYSAKLAAFKTELDKPISVTFTLLGLDGTPLIAKTTEKSFTKGTTVFDVFKKILTDNNISYTAKGSYITSINGLAEYDYGKYSGWMYTVGNVFINSYMNAQELAGGEDIIVMYVTDYALANRPINETNNPNQGNNSNNKPNNNNTNSNNNQNDKTNINQNTQANNNAPNNIEIISSAVNNNSNGASSVSNNSVNMAAAKVNSESDNTTTKKSIQDNESSRNTTENNSNNNDTLDRNSDNDKSTTYENSDNSNKPAIIVGTVAGVFLLTLIIIVIAIKKRKKNTEK